MSNIVETDFLLEGKKRWYKHNIVMEVDDHTIKFLKSSRATKDVIKAMQGSRCHFDDQEKFSHWSVDNSTRNRFQLEYLQGGNPYEWFEKPINHWEYPKFGSDGFGYYDLMNHQVRLADIFLTHHYQVWGAEMGTGKTLAAIAAMVMSRDTDWWWVGPKNSLNGIRQEFDKWGLPSGIVTQFMSYESMLKVLREWKSGTPAPRGVIFDESQFLKTPTTQRTQGAQRLADAVRAEYGYDGYVLLMTGTPSPLNPADWWAQAEIAWPGFLREGSREALEWSLGFHRMEENFSGMTYPTRVAWRENEEFCEECGLPMWMGTVKKNLVVSNHSNQVGEPPEDYDEARLDDFEEHEWTPSVNEVARMYDRLEGLATIVHKKDCLDLPDKIYKTIECDPSPSTKRVAKALMNTAPNVITGLTWLRELSDGFQYRDIEDGYKECDACLDGTITEWYHPEEDMSLASVDDLDISFVEQLEKREVECKACDGTQKVVKYKRITKDVPCPKDEVLKDLLEQNWTQGRMVVFAAFSGSLDKITNLCHEEGWDTLRIDGKKNFQIQKPDGKIVKLKNPMDYWIDYDVKNVVIVAHPKSGGVSLTLCPQGDRPGATMSVFYSNDFNAGARTQAEDRIHRQGMIGSAMIVDLFHLDTDRRVLEVLKKNRKLELMTMGDLGFEDD